MSLSTSIRTRFLPAVLFLTVAFGIAAVGFAADDAKPSKLPKPAEATKTTKVEFEAITLLVPESWEWQPNLSKRKKLEYKIAPVEGDSEAAELYVSSLFNFDLYGGTGPAINDWIKTFQPEGRKSKVTEGTSPQGRYTIVDITGTYNKQVGVAVKPTRPLPEARMLAAILHPKDDLHYCVILSGPNKTVSAAAKAFRDSFAADAKKEKELKLEEVSK